MPQRLRRFARCWRALSASALLAAGTAQAQPLQPAVPPPTAQPALPPTPPPAPPAPMPEDVDTEELASLAAPNMIGHFLDARRSVRFFVNRTSSASFINAVGATSIVNPAVADNNSPVPQDRVYFRFNHFADAVSVTGASSQPAVPLPGVPGTLLAATTTQAYNVDLYTFGFEKTFFDRRASLEMRVPFSTGLAADLDLSYGALTSDATRVLPEGPRVFQNVVNTPQDSLGSEGTQFGNIVLILKWLMLQRSGLYFSSGLAGTIPTGNDTRIRVTDFLGPTPTAVDTLRSREFHVRNQTWGLSPFLAALVTPTERCFVQGFLQFDVPLNSSAVTYTETVRQTPGAQPLIPERGTFALAPPFSVRDHINEQYLCHVDVGLGYWLLRRPEARYLTGFAPSLECHYTTTLSGADIVTLPGDSATFLANRFAGNVAPLPQVGNLRDRLDIIDLTLGTTFEFAQRTRIATAFSLPLRGADNRTYDWEFHVQLNCYFGPAATRLPPAPNF